MKKDSDCKHRWLILFLSGALTFLFVLPAFADTYNFIFPREKKKSVKKHKVEPVEVQEDDSADPDAPEEVETQKNENHVKADSDKNPIVINNYNTLNGTNKSETTVPPAAAAAVPAAPATSVVSVIKPRKHHFRFGGSALVIPRRTMKSDFFDSGNLQESGIGGLVSFAFVPAPAFTLNTYGGMYQMKDRKQLYITGLDCELYPFSAGHDLSDPQGLELGFLLGMSTALFGDNSLASLHAGARLNINFSPTFGLTAVGRVSSDYFMTEAGFITRL